MLLEFTKNCLQIPERVNQEHGKDRQSLVAILKKEWLCYNIGKKKNSKSSLGV